MKTKISILWIFLTLGWIVHHLYNVFNIYYNDTLMMEDANRETPFIHHIFRILFEGFCFMFGLLTIKVSKKWVMYTSFVLVIIVNLYDVYHLFEIIINESDKISEVFMLALVSITSIFLIKNINILRKKSINTLLE